MAEAKDKKKAPSTIDWSKVDGAVGAEYQRISTGSITLDHMLNGGIREDSWVHIQGKEGAGKTALLAGMVNEAIKLNRRILYICAETGSVPDRFFSREVREKYITMNGTPGAFNVEELMGLIQWWQKEYAEDIKKYGGFIALDSYQAMGVVAREDVDDTLIGALARKASLATPLIKKAMLRPLGQRMTPFVVIVQSRSNFDRAGFASSPTKSEANRSWEHEAVVDIELSRTGWVKEGDEVVGSKVKILLGKSKLSQSHQAAEVLFTNGRIDRTNELLNFGLAYKLIAKSNNTYTITVPDDDGELKEYKTTSGVAAARNMIRDNGKIDEYLTTQIRERMSMQNGQLDTTPTAAPEPEEPEETAPETSW
jgi:recombination protein RecA